MREVKEEENGVASPLPFPLPLFSPLVLKYGYYLDLQERKRFYLNLEEGEEEEEGFTSRVLRVWYVADKEMISMKNC